MLGLSLGGGGTKGSYELGAIIALKELNYNFDIVTGSSIGALNAAMIVEDDITKFISLWSNVDINNVLKNGFNIEEYDFLKIIHHNDFKPFLKQVIKEKGTDVEPFKKLLWNNVDFNKIQNSKILYGVVISTFPFRKKEEIVLNNLNVEQMFNTLLASCSLFPVFPTVSINNKHYMDGGFSDNLPIEFAFKLGAREVIAIDLEHEITHREYLNNTHVKYIYPKWDLGTFLNFDQASINRNKQLGYNDTMKYFNKYDGFKFTFIKDNTNLNLSKKITLKILNDTMYFNSNNLKTIDKKSRNNNIFGFLNKHIYRKINDYDYFLKTIEELGEIYKLDPTKIYDINQYLSEIFSKINMYEDNTINEKLSNIQLINKKIDYINSCDKKKIINYLFNKKFNFEFRIILLQTNFSLYLSLVLFESLGDNNEI